MDNRNLGDNLLYNGPLPAETNVDLNAAVAETTLFTVPVGKSCIITKVIMFNPVGAGLPGGTAELSFGWDTGNADDVIDQAVIAITAATNFVTLLPVTTGVAVLGVAGGTFKITVAVAEGAALTADFLVFGVLY